MPNERREMLKFSAFCLTIFLIVLSPLACVRGEIDGPPPPVTQTRPIPYEEREPDPITTTTTVERIVTG